MSLLSIFKRPQTSSVDLFQQRRRQAAAYLGHLPAAQYNPETFGSKNDPRCLIGHFPRIFPKDWTWKTGIAPKLNNQDENCRTLFAKADQYLGRTLDYFLPKEEMIEQLLRD